MERGERAEHRYNKKVRDYLTQEEILNQLLEDRSFFVDDGGEPVKVDLSTVELPKLKFKEEEQEGTGQGDGDMEGQGESDGEGSGKGQEGDSPAEGENGDTDSDGDKSEQAHGNKPGYGKEKDESYEDEFTLEDIADFWLDKYGLPKVNDYEGLSGKTIEGDFEELDKTGIRQDLNLRETLKQNIKYNLIKDGHAVVKDIDIKRDGIYDVEDEKKWSALEVYVIDTSPSMNKPRRDLSRLFSFLVSRYLDKKYESNERRFVIFSNTAEECDGDEFFTKRTGYTTTISSGIELAAEIANDHKYNDYDKFLFVFSDSEDEVHDIMDARKTFKDAEDVYDRIYYGDFAGLPPQSKEEYESIAKDREKSGVRSRMGSVYSTYDFYELIALGDEKKVRGYYLKDIEGVVDGLRLFLNES